MSFEDFRKEYEPNLGRHSVNYHSWWVVDKPTMDWLLGIYNDKSVRDSFKNDGEHEITVKNFHSGDVQTFKFKYRVGNIEQPIPFQEILHPWLDAPFDMGFCDLPRYNKMLCGDTHDLEKINNIAFRILDNNHWPALLRESIILIREDVVG